MRQVVIRYEAHPDRAAENEALIDAVFEDLARIRPDGLRYVVLRDTDGSTFIHVAEHDDDRNTLLDVPAFNRFQEQIRERIAVGPVRVDARIVGSYRAFGEESS